MKPGFYLPCGAIACIVLLAGCQTPESSSASRQASSDHRIPVPLIPRMAEHQRENMRDHLLAVREIIAGVSSGDYAGVERSANRIGYSEQMGQMCERMGAGAPGFNEMALQFHHTADTIAAAARTHDSAATLKALSATLETCVSSHAAYRQEIVSQKEWDRRVRKL